MLSREEREKIKLTKLCDLRMRDVAGLLDSLDEMDAAMAKIPMTAARIDELLVKARNDALDNAAKVTCHGCRDGLEIEYFEGIFTHRFTAENSTGEIRKRYDSYVCLASGIRAIKRGVKP